MKYTIAFVMLAALGCAVEQPVVPEESNIGDYAPKHSTSGQNANIMWKCNQSFITQNSVWIDCGFTNGAKTPQSMCLNLYYNRDHSSVLANNKVCSGIIPANGMTIAPGAITKNRIPLNELCGPTLQDCELRSVEFTPVDYNPTNKHKK